MTLGLHIVKSRARGDKPVIWYVYAWRGGPCVHRSTGVRPNITRKMIERAAELRLEARRPENTFSGLLDEYMSEANPRWAKLSPRTADGYRTHLEAARARFGKASLKAFSSHRMRGDLYEWRDSMASHERKADLAMEVMRTVLGWALRRGKVTINIAEGFDRLYDGGHRAHVIWEPEDLKAFKELGSPHVNDGLDLCSLTGLRRGDLVQLPWSAVGEDAIDWTTEKSRRRRRILIPLLPQTKDLLTRIKARQEDDWKKSRKKKLKKPTETVLFNSKGNSWTRDGFSTVFNRTKKEAGIDKRLHDVRGTFVTWLALAGLTDQQIARIVGWSEDKVAAIRRRYVDEKRVISDLAKQIAEKMGVDPDVWSTGQPEDDDDDD